MDINATFWHRATVYFTYFKTLLWLPNMNNINPFFSEISQLIHQMYEKVALITQIWHRAKCYITSMSITWYLISVQNMKTITTFFSEISWGTLNIYEKMVLITQIWHRVKFYFTCISGPWYLIMVPNMKKIHPVITKECTRSDRQRRLTDGWTGPFSVFTDSA